jgi:two-component system OmpR family response regulator
MERTMRILLVENDLAIGQKLMTALQEAGYAVDWVCDSAAASRAIDIPYTVVLLDLGLPGKPGLQLLRRMRHLAIPTPVIILTFCEDVDTRVTCLDSGADDFLSKPFEVRELLARIRAVLRRKAGYATSGLGSGNLILNLNTRRLTYNGQTQLLSAKEFALVVAFLERPGVILSRRQLEEKLYGWGQEVESNAVDALIYCIRRKFSPTVIRNVRGLGWSMLVDQDDGAAEAAASVQPLRYTKAI